MKKLGPGGAAAILGGLILSQILPLWARGLTPFWGDLTYLHHPWRALQAQLLEAGRMPLWNPYVYLGMPLAATMQGSLFYPGSLPFFLFPLADALALFEALHYWLAGFLCYLWLRSLRLAPWACLGGGLLFCLGGVLVSRLPFLNHLAVLSLSPGLLLFFRRPALLSLVLALAFFAGYPPFLIGSVLGAWVLSLGAAPRGLGPWLASSAWGWTAAGLSALGLSGCLLLPAAELFLQSRRASGIGLEEALQFGFAFRDLIGWISPVLAGWKEFGSALEWWKSCYLGFSGALAVALGFRRLERVRAVGLGVALAGLLLMTLAGSNRISSAAWARIPGLQFVRYPGNLSYLAALPLSLLAAAGLQGLPGRAWLTLLAAAELSLYWKGAFPVAQRSLFSSAGPLVRSLEASLGDERYLISPRALEAQAGAGVWDWRFRLYGLTNAPFRLRAAGNFGEPLVPKASYEFMDALYRAPSAALAAALFPWAGIRILLTPGLLPPSQALRHEGRRLWEVYRFQGELGRAYGFDESSGARIPEGLAEAPSVGAPLAFHGEREDRFRVEGVSSAPGWVFVSEPRYPGWSARLKTSSGFQEIESLPAMGAFQKIQVPAGPWTLEFLYRPLSWRLGVLLTALFLLGHALWVWRWALRAG